jgi:hypothetical protein
MKPLVLTSVLTSALIPILALIVQLQTAHAQQAPSGIQIIGVDAMGNGCRPNSVSSNISPDSKDLSLFFDDFISNSGAASSNLASADKKMCIVNVQLALPDGWSMGLLTADYRGFAALDRGTQGQHEVLYSFNKDFAGSSFSSSVMRGPMSENYFIRNSMRADQVNWSQCGLRQITLTVRIGLVTQILNGAPGRPSAQITLDSVDTSTRQSFAVGWRRCSSGGGVGPSPQPPPGGNRPGPFDPNPPGGGGNNGGNSGTISIFQMWNGITRYYTQDSRLAERGTWVNQGIVFQIFSQMSRQAPMPLFQCLIRNQPSNAQKYFLSNDRNCEGQQMERQLGFVSQNGGGGLMPLNRFVSHSDSTDFLATVNSQDAQGLRFDRGLGYVQSSRPNVIGRMR